MLSQVEHCLPTHAPRFCLSTRAPGLGRRVTPARRVSVPVGRALSFKRATCSTGRVTHPPNRALFWDGLAPVLGARQQDDGKQIGNHGMNEVLADTRQSSARSDRSVVAVAVLDGFYGCGSGAGWSNRALIEILAEVLPIGIDLVVLPVRVDAVIDRWQREWRRAVGEALGRSVRRVEVRALDGNRGGAGRHGEPALTGAVERAIARLRWEYRRGLVVLCDVEFSGAAARSTADSAWTTVIVPRTSALLVQPELAARVAWERESLRRAAEMGVWIAAISGYMRSHLTEQVGVPASAVVDLRNGVSGVDAEPKIAGVADLPPAAWGGFWLAMGRAVPEKGFEDLVDALCLLRDRGVRAPHVVLAAVSEGVDLSPYQGRLAGRVEREQLDVSLRTRFSPQVRGLLAHRSIMGVIVPSRVEPFGRIPLEAYAAGAAPVVATRAGGLAELVVEGRSGYLAEPHDPADLAQALRRAVMADTDTRARMRGHGREILHGFDYRDSVRSLLRQVAPWLTPAGQPSVRVGVAASGPAAGRGVAVVQVPEVCGWNPYVAAAEAALVGRGVRVVRPGLCCDVHGPAARPPLRQPVEVDAATIVHLHWPEKLAHQHGVDAATAVLRELVERGAKIVQTVHNVRPHETTPELAAFLRLVDDLTTGAHFFSADHEAQARSARPGLPHRVLHLPHPRFTLRTPPAASVMAGSVGLLGRLRDYKRTVGFARVYLQALGPEARMVIAGHVDEPEVHRGLAELAVQYPGLDYQPGFVPEERFWRLLGEVAWVALPYRQLYSSGVLVAALQLGRRIISPVPTGGTGLYGTGLDQGQWRTVQPWDDTRAVEVLLAARDPAPPVGELTLPSWSEAAEAMAGFYARLVQDTPTPATGSTSTGGAAPTGRTPVPVHARSTDGEVFDFGTHANDFLVRREESLATETFLVRVPGGGAVPEHVHTDMEQTFVFVSGVGEATLSRGGEQIRRFGCGPGDVVFVPAGWRHTVLAQSVEGLVYLTVNSFVPGADRVGASAVAHAVAVQPGFRATGHAPRAAHAEPLAVFRSAETAFRIDEDGRRMWPRDFTALDTTLRRDPNTYRVRQLGPFEYVTSVTTRPRILTAELADRLFAAASGHLPVLVEGSQSPISVKAPCEESDLDILVAVESGDDLTLARKVLEGLAEQMDHVRVPLSLGVVHARWLELPNFYSALSLDPAAPDRRWWTAADPDRLGEATRRIQRGLDLLQNPDTVRSLLARSLEVADRGTEQIGEWRLIPRWKGYV